MVDFEFAEKCPLCGGKGVFYKDGKETSTGMVVKTDKCLECGVIYQNPRMTRESIIKYYSSGKYHLTHPPGTDSEKARSNRVMNIIRGLEMFPSRALDIGCGRGLLLKTLQDNFNTEIVGVDLYKMAGLAIDKLVKRKEDVKGKFDLIISLQALEHAYDPQEELRWMVDRLDTGGTIILELPMKEKIYLPHVFNFSQMSSKLMLMRMGLKFIYLEYANNGMFLIGEHFANVRVTNLVSTIGADQVYEGMYH